MRLGLAGSRVEKAGGIPPAGGAGKLFSLQTLNLVRNGEIGRAGGNIALSFVLCLLSVWLGHVAAGSPNQPKGT